MRHLFFYLFLAPALLCAAKHSGSVRAADQFIPGAMVTAVQGDNKITAFTDEYGHYSMDLAPGVWDVQIQMLGFTAVRQQVTVGSEPSFKDWALEMPRIGEPLPGSESKATPEAKPPAPANPAAPTRPRAAAGGRGGSARAGIGPGTGAGPGRGGASGPGEAPGRGGPPVPGQATARPGFQSATVTATQDGQQALADAAGAASGGLGDLSASGDADDSFLVNGSTSGGLAQSSDDEARRQRALGGGRGGPPPGGPGGPGGPDASFSGLGLPPGMSAPDSDPFGLSGLGASAINGGFGGGPGGFGGGPGAGPGGGGGRGGGGRGGGGGGGGGGRGGGGRGGRGGARNRGRGPYNGQFASFGNRRRTQPPITGSVFANLNNSALNAAPFSLNGKSVAKPSSNQVRFGGNIGGPLVIPKLLNLPRWNFNITYQGAVTRNPYSQVASLPTLAERDGDFSGISSIIYDPLTKLPFQDNKIPKMYLSSAALGLLKYFPQPTSTGLVQNYNIAASTPNNNNSIGVRLNAPLTNKDRLNFNVQFQNRDSASQQLFGFRDSSTGSGLSAATGWSHSFGRRTNNNANLSLSRNNNKSAPFFAYTDNVAAALGINGTSQDPINFGPPNLSFTNFGSLSDGSASVTRSQTISFTDAITYVVKRKHNLTFGYMFRKMQQNSLTYQNARGSYSFSGLLTSALTSAGQPVSGTGYDFADFLLGLPQSSSIRFGGDNNYFRGWATSWYAQDDYRISRGLSVNVGLRYEYFSPYTELHGHLANLDVSPGFTAVSVVTPGQTAPYSGSLPTSLLRSDPNNYSPRFGFAWRPSQKKSTVLRGGYSIFFSGSSYPQIATQMASQPPFAKTASISTSLINPLTIQNGFATTPSQSITNTYSVDPNYKLAYAQTWTAAIQHTLPHGLLVELEYIGTKGTRLGVVEQPNRAPPGSPPLSAQQLLQISNASGFSYQTSGANSSFNAGQARVTRRFQRGMSATAQYTFSKSIDDASSFNGTGGTTVQFINNWGLERGLSSFDQRHKLQLTYTLSSPVGVRGFMRNGGWKTKALTGWTLNGNFAASSGTPLTARLGGNLSNTGGTAAFGSSRAEATGLPIEADGYPYFNLLAFTNPVAGQYGNAGRDTIPGLFQTSLNASLNRAFRLGSETRRQLQLRLSANNALNHVTITNVGTTVGSATYGLPTSASGTRTITLMLRFNF